MTLTQYMRMYKHNPKPTDVIRYDEVEKLLFDFGRECFEAARHQKLLDEYPDLSAVRINKYPTFDDYINHIKLIKTI